MKHIRDAAHLIGSDGLPFLRKTADALFRFFAYPTGFVPHSFPGLMGNFADIAGSGTRRSASILTIGFAGFGHHRLPWRFHASDDGLPEGVPCNRSAMEVNRRS